VGSGRQRAGIDSRTRRLAAFANAALICEVVNTGPTAVITLEARNYAGTVVSSVGRSQYVSGETHSWYAADTGGAYCKFDIVAGSPKRIRAQAVYADLVTGYRLIAVPAR
jgi:hypothetical protein